MDHVLTVTLCLALVALASALHYEALHYASEWIPELPVRQRRRTLILVIVVMMAHAVEIGLYAIGYWLAVKRLELGSLIGSLEHDALDYIYYSAATFTTLGVGDIVPTGPIRLLAGVQSLNGLVLITWSASFTYLSMEKSWAGRP